jgi:hypothetical protein
MPSLLGAIEPGFFTVFVLLSWSVLEVDDFGDDEGERGVPASVCGGYEPVSVPSWSEERALTSLGVRIVPFDHLDGNVQGYATQQGDIAINPVAALPHKTLFHEVAHALLQHTKDATIPKALCEVEEAD